MEAVAVTQVFTALVLTLMNSLATPTQNANGIPTTKCAMPNRALILPMDLSATKTRHASGMAPHKRAKTAEAETEAEAEAVVLIAGITTMQATQTLKPHSRLCKTAEMTQNASGRTKQSLEDSMGHIQDFKSTESALVLEAEEEEAEAAEARVQDTLTQKAARPTLTTFARGIQVLIHRATPAQEVETEMEAEEEAVIHARLTIRQFLLSGRQIVRKITAELTRTGVYGQE